MHEFNVKNANIWTKINNNGCDADIPEHPPGHDPLKLLDFSPFKCECYDVKELLLAIEQPYTTIKLKIASDKVKNGIIICMHHYFSLYQPYLHINVLCSHRVEYC